MNHSVHNHTVNTKFARQRRNEERAARAGRRICKAVMESLEERRLLSSVSSTTTAATWMSALPGTTPLTTISVPGTTQSASGPALQDALLGTGSEDEVSTSDPATSALTYTSLAAHVLAGTALETVILAGGSDQLANGASIAANAAAEVSDVAVGINAGSYDGAGLYIGWLSDTTTVASVIAAFNQVAKANASSTADAAATAADAAVTTDDTAAAAAHTAAGTANATAGGSDAAAGGADAAAGGADATAGGLDLTAGTTDTAAGVADAAAATADVVAAAQGSIDPVADGVAAGLDTAAAVADTAAGVADTAAGVSDGVAAGLDTAAATADGTAVGTNATAVTADGAAGASDAAVAASNTTASAAYGTAATNHTAGAITDGLSAAAFTAAATSDGLAAGAYGTFASKSAGTDTTGGNSLNSGEQAAIYKLTVAGATLHAASAGSEGAAAVANGIATHLNTVAAGLDTAAVNALAAATAANAAAVSANSTAGTLDAAAATADAAASGLDATAGAADVAAATADATAGGLDAAAGIADGIAAGADAAAAAAETTAIALDITALATIEIPFVDIATAAAAAIADGIAIGLDITATAADTAAAVADGLATAADVTATALDVTATAADVAATAADVTATAADTAATTADATATGLDTAAANADAAAVAACKAADAANEAADAADANANTVNHVATLASLASVGADVAFTIATTQALKAVTATQTQSLTIADQLNAGVRSLDLRGAQVNDAINLNAGIAFTGVTLQSALDDMTSFLQANPSETIVVSLSSNEAAAVNSANSFNADLTTLLNKPDAQVPNTAYGDFIYASNDPTATPTLDQARGKIVIIPAANGGWTPTADANNLTIGWQPTQVTQDSHTITDANTRWNYAENDNGGNDTGLIPTDLGNPSTLYRNNLNQDNTDAASPVTLGDAVNAIAQPYFSAVKATRTTGIVGMTDAGGVLGNDPTQTFADNTIVDETLINEIVDQNNLPIIVTSDSDTPGDAGTLRAAIAQANSQPGINTIEFADTLTGPTGNTIILTADLPLVTNDLNVTGSVYINTKGFQSLTAAANHSVTETNYVASDNAPVAPQTSNHTTPVYLDVYGLTNVAPAPVAVTPVHITYGTALTNSQLHGTATYTVNNSPVVVDGAFTYTTAAGTVLHAGNGQVEAVTFTPTDTTTYAVVTGTVIVDVAKAAATVTSVNAVHITYGTPLANSQLHGVASVPGTFVYNDAGALPHAGNAQNEAVTFVPTDATDYKSVHATAVVSVAKATPTVTGVDAVNISPGAALDNNQLTGSATVSINGSPVSIYGTFTYNSVGTVLPAGKGQTQAVTFTPNDSTDFTTAQSTVTVNVARPAPAAPDLNISPINITYRTALANSQISGFAVLSGSGTFVSVSGKFSFTSAAGTVLHAGDGQSIAVTFTPDDTVNYLTAHGTVTVNVAQALPFVVNVKPVNLTYGTALSPTQLDGNASFTGGGSTVGVSGKFTYTSTTGSVLNAGNGQAIDVTFTPDDATDYTTAASTVTVNVTKATPNVTSVNAVNIQYGTLLANTQLSGTANYTVGGNLVPVTGTFTYTTAAGALLNVANGQTKDVTFTPDDATDFKAVASKVTVNVAKFIPIVTVHDAGGIYTGSPFPATGTAKGLPGVDLGTPNFTYYLSTDTTFAHALVGGAPVNVGNYVAVASTVAVGNYDVGAAKTPFSITAASTSTAISSSAPTAVYGQQVAYTATVTNASGTPAVPVGSVQFVIDGVNFGAPVALNSAGQAVSAPTSFPTGASHKFQAIYIPSPNFTASTSATQTQVVQAIAVEGTALFLGSSGASSSDQIQINAIGTSATGSTGVQIITRLNGVNTTTNYNQAFSSVNITLQGGNDSVILNSKLTVGAFISAGNGNDTIQLSSGGPNSVKIGDGNDQVTGGGNATTVVAGAGNDSVTLGVGSNDSVTLGGGNDTVQIGNGSNESIVVGNGNDSILLGNGSSDVVTLGAGNDHVQIGIGNNNTVYEPASVRPGTKITFGNGTNNTIKKK